MAYFSKRKHLYLLVLPALIFYFVYMIWPFFRSVYVSMTEYTILGVGDFCGLENYTRIFQNRQFWISLKNTAITCGVVMVLLVPSAFSLALLLHGAKKGTNIYRTLFFIPVIISTVLAGIIWVFILDPSTGLLNAVLRAIGLEKLALEWIGGVKLTPFSVGIVYIWQQVGYQATLLYAGLQQIPQDLYDAARIDGAKRWQIILHLEIPMLKETFLITYILALTGSLKVFSTAKMLTGGGPNRISETLVHFMYNTFYSDKQVAMGSAVAVLVFLLTFGCSLLLIRLYSARDKKGGAPS